MKEKKNLARQMIGFVLIVGIINFFADMTYEGSRSVIGAFMGTLGATATIIGFVSGFGEFVGYAFRSMTGLFVDRTQRYWLFAFVGYAINMLAVPALALAGNWPFAAALIIAERTGKAIRRPAVETMLSFTTKTMGRGWVFGLNEALDQAGATLGPLIVALVLYLKGGYRHAFAVLLISALLCLTTVLVAWFFYRRPREFEQEETKQTHVTFSKSYWFYVIGGSLIAAGFADFALIAFHIYQNHIIDAHTIPIVYSLAMVVAAIASLFFGKLLDEIGDIFFFAFFISSFFAPFVFSESASLIIIGAILWGIGLGSQDSLIKAVLSKIVSSKKRGTGFGIFDTIYGIGWFIGSATMGWLYDHSILILVIFSIVTQISAIPFFFVANKFKEA
jgi:MFS family permease